MIRISPQTIVLLATGLALAVGGDLLRRYGKRFNPKMAKLLPKFGWGICIFGVWLFLSELLPLVFGHGESEGLTVEIAPERQMLLGLSVSDTVIITWYAMALIIITAFIIRYTVIPKMQMVPRGIQNILETMVDGINGYAQSKAHGLGENLSAYLFIVAVLLIASAAVELLGVRAPTSDITMTAALAIITFLMINYYGVKQKGLKGRFQALNAQGPLVMLLRVVSDCAVPVSMACRLFGNMLGGMVVMDLLYSALGSHSVGIPSVLGLYFNVFHPLIQAFIFITLTLTFINEAIE